MGQLHKYEGMYADPLYDKVPPNTITCFAGGEEMLRVSTDGFWVRGEKVDQDDKEAQAVYNSFKEWLTWQQLNRG
jgi:hypothetical protein